MPRRTPTPPPPALPQWRVLQTLEKVGAPGFHAVGDIVGPDQVRPESLLILLEKGIVMPYLDPDQIRALPELA
jgi:hypothetical protein